MKMKFKAALSLMIVVMMVAISGVSALAATYTYSTIYTKDSAGDVAVKVTATASDVAEGEQVTYYAKNGDKVVYIDQEEAGSSKTVNFSYVTDNATGLTQNFGGTSLSNSQPVGEKTGNTVTVAMITTYEGSDYTENQKYYVIAQDEGVEITDYAPRTFAVSANRGAIKSMYFQPTGSQKKIIIEPGACLYVGETIIVYPAVFTTDGALYVEHAKMPEEFPTIHLGDLIKNNVNDYIVLGRVFGARYEEAGICVDFSDDTTYEGVSVDDNGAHLFPASQFGSDGSFAISLQDEAATHFCDGASVKAYVKLGDGTILYSDRQSQFTESNFWTE